MAKRTASVPGKSDPAQDSQSFVQAVRVLVGNRLRTHRMHQRISGTALAQRAGISKGMLSKIESAERIPSVPVLANLAKVLGISVGDLFGPLSAFTEPIFTPAGSGRRTQVEDFEVEDLGELQTSGMQLRVLVSVVRTPIKSTPSVQFEGFWIDYVLEGEIVVLSGTERFHMNPGDTLIFRGELPHSMRVVKGPARVFSVQGWAIGSTLNHADARFRRR